MDRIEPMLAKTYVRKLTKMPVIVQPKFNGYRSLCTRDDCWTRELNDHARDLELNLFRKLQMELPEGLMLDGEIYAHGYLLQDIISLGKSWQLESSLLKYHVYDCMLLDDKQATFADRWAVLKRWFKDNEHPGAVLSPTNIAHDHDFVADACTHWVEKGYEGLIIRDPDEPYVSGRYGRKLQKMKMWKDAEWKIIKVTEKTGDHRGMPVFHCRSQKGVEFKVNAVGPHPLQRQQWEQRDELVGKLLTITYHDVTRDMVPGPIKNAVVRDYE